MTVWLSDMEVTEGFMAKVGVFECVDVGDMNVGPGYERMEFVHGIREGAEELCEIQGEGVMWS